MTTVEYLRQISILQDSIKRNQGLVNEIKRNVSSAKAIQYDKDRVQTSITGSVLEELIIKCVDAEIKLEELRLECIKKKSEIFEEIHSLNDRRYISILYKRYVECKKFEKIACEMDYDFDYVRSLHRRAIIAFEDKHGTKYLKTA